MNKNYTLFYVCNNLEEQQTSIIYAKKIFDDFEEFSKSLSYINCKIDENIINSIMEYANTLD